jgi:hypothetical protein
MLNINPDEALAVNFAFQLHHMPEECAVNESPPRPSSSSGSPGREILRSSAILSLAYFTISLCVWNHFMHSFSSVSYMKSGYMHAQCICIEINT